MPSVVILLLLAVFAPGIGTAHAEDAALTLSIGPQTRRFTAVQLLGRPDATELSITADVSYRPDEVPCGSTAATAWGRERIGYHRSTCRGWIRIANSTC